MERIGHVGDRPADLDAGRRRAPRHSDAGGSLIEVLFSVGILGTVGVGILVSLMAAIRGADRREDGVEVEARLVTAVEVVRAESFDYVPCVGDPIAVADTYTVALTGVLPVEDAISVAVTDVTFWDGSTLVPGCGSVPPDTLQWVTLEATRGTTTASAVVSKLPGTVVP